MDWISTSIIAVGLAMDAFAVSLGIGTTGGAISPRPIFRLAFHFGLFQGGMTLLGWIGGMFLAHLISGIDHWVILGLLGWVGIRMILSGFSNNQEHHLSDPSRGGLLMLLSVATSLDALAIGISFAVLEVDILFSAIVIMLITAGLSLLGLLLGGRLGLRFGKRMEILGGIILIGIGFRVVFSHLHGL